MKTVGVCVVGVLALTALLEFLAPDLSYELQDRAREWLTPRAGKPFRIAVGAMTGSAYRVAATLNRHLAARAGYELELVADSVPGGSIQKLQRADDHVDLAMASSADEVGAEGVVGLARLDSQFLFVIVPNDGGVREVRDLAGPVNPGTRDGDAPPTLGERVLDYYGQLAAVAGGTGGRVSVVRPEKGNVADFESGHNVAETRTQALNSELIADVLRNGAYRLVPIRDNEALARAIPGTRPGLIPAGLFGPERRIPPEPVPTLVTSQLLLARADLPARVVRDILAIVYDASFLREVGYDVTEQSGRELAGWPLHPAAEAFYHRNDPVTADRVGRLSFVASVVAALFAIPPVVTHFRRRERIRRQRRRLAGELSALQSIRARLEAADLRSAEALIREADDLLSRAELDGAADLLDVEGLESLRALHQVCWRALEHRRSALGRTDLTRLLATLD
ncbi:MAG TPA: hypothetical protein VMU03_16050 [Gammaproteobacteria bacterium]|nr:hypothetical protein [Gammaproteobacteria bacterium]